MNIENGLEEPMKEISAFNGVCLSLVERIKLETTLDQLKSDIKCDEMQFWGIIYGAEKDYYIAKALYYKGYPQFPKKKYFFCSSSNFIFSELPSLNPHQIPNFHKYNTYFIGNPDIILEKYDSGNSSNFDEENEGDSFRPRTKKKNMTETDRLSFVVRAIDRDCAVVPVGGFKMMPINELRRNDLFEGINSEDLEKKEKYVHFRPVENQEKKDKIAMGKAVLDFEFLDSIADDPIKDSWSIHVDSTKTTSSLRSLVWPGYFAYCKANSDQFGGVYIGYGIKNVDIPFMQQ
jgi:radial spoke head protein 9